MGTAFEDRDGTCGHIALHLYLVLETGRNPLSAPAPGPGDAEFGQTGRSLTPMIPETLGEACAVSLMAWETRRLNERTDGSPALLPIFAKIRGLRWQGRFSQLCLATFRQELAGVLIVSYETGGAVSG